MKIICLGWGSLLWKTGPLPVSGDWHADGPFYPIEFSRVGDNGELSTAVCLNAPLVQVFWALLAVDTLEQACEALRQREQIPPERTDGIGVLISQGLPIGPLAEWAQQRQIDAVIWTALPPRIAHNEGQIPTIDEAIAYLRSLEGEKREHARNYFVQMPLQLDTPYRRAIKQQLGWGA
ncbi:hypothetical protein COO59_00455 [Mixta theicola]|uniref:Uncharacterized protein n=1 Tax=Mixta theicola TaxID=1458355 RepID=A0A2K1QE76_9GAMM|nr:hypothetical protein [Mixta theicola]PNS13330.1 hypothetical protein COO59_00455 [Mixta theicola]GLR09629.1 hypothetical protein GCM10007905_23490 [Mixta theicola]